MAVVPVETVVSHVALIYPVREQHGIVVVIRSVPLCVPYTHRVSSISYLSIACHSQLVVALPYRDRIYLEDACCHLPLAVLVALCHGESINRLRR